MERLSYLNAYLFPVAEWLICSITLHKMLGQGRRRGYAGILLFFIIAGVTIISSYLTLPNIFAVVTFTLIFVTIASLLIYQTPPQIAAFFCVAVFYINIIADLLVGNILMTVFGGDIVTTISNCPIQRMIFSFTAKMIQLFLSIALTLGFNRISWNIPAIYWVILDTIVGCSCALSLGFVAVNPFLQTKVKPEIVAVMVLLFLIVNILTVVLFATISSHYIKAQLEYISNVTKARLENDLQLFEKDKEKLKKVNHDFKNTLNNIALLINNNEITEALNYLAGYSARLPDTQIEHFTGISSIDSMISIKAAAAEDHCTKMTIVSETLPPQGMPSIDIATILSNILDNSIESNGEVPVEKRFITLNCYVQRGYLNVVTTNPYKVAPLKVNNRLITRKRDIDSHGYGTIIVREICEKHNGHFIIEYSNGVFSAHATLLLKNAMSLEEQ
ncbi:GHKL domain-containing protein [Ruminococcaceae bacterium OttesenSCG-928-I18]|nr:GHKL domain-containing protein [Ruminococcaceae bacterium OttesenSCG-928-I18]